MYGSPLHQHLLRRRLLLALSGMLAGQPGMQAGGQGFAPMSGRVPSPSPWPGPIGVPMPPGPPQRMVPPEFSRVRPGFPSGAGPIGVPGDYVSNRWPAGPSGYMPRPPVGEFPGREIAWPGEQRVELR